MTRLPPLPPLPPPPPLLLLLRTSFSLLFALALATADCPENYEHFSDEGTCIRVFMGHRYTWLEAAKLCRREGGHLVEVHSQAKAEFVKETIRAMSFRDDPDFWINLADFGGLPGDFWWMTSRQNLSPDSFSDWLDGHPDPEVTDSAVIMCQDSGSDLRWRNFYPEHEALPVCELAGDTGTGPTRLREFVQHAQKMSDTRSEARRDDVRAARRYRREAARRANKFESVKNNLVEAVRRKTADRAMKAFWH